MTMTIYGGLLVAYVAAMIALMLLPAVANKVDHGLVGLLFLIVTGLFMFVFITVMIVQSAQLDTKIALGIINAFVGITNLLLGAGFWKYVNS